MGWYDLLALVFAQAAGRIYGLVLGVAEFFAYVLQWLWVATVRAFLAIIEWADEQWSDLGIADNPLWRTVLAGGIGFILAIIAVLIVAVVLGHSELVCLFILVVGFCAFVGLMADPDKDWSLPSFPGSGKRKGPGVPINL